MRSPSAFTYPALFLALLFWGLSFVWTKLALSEFGPFTLIFFRFALASVLFVIVLLLVEKRLPRLSLKDHGKMILLALFQPLLYFIFESLGILNTSASKASLIVASIPLVVLGLSALLLKEKAGPAVIVSVLLSIVGIGLLTLGDPNFSWSMSSSLKGDLYMLGAVLAAAGYMVFTRFLGKTHSVLVITFMQMSYGAIFLCPFFLWEVWHQGLPVVSAKGWAAFSALTLLASFTAFLCYNFALTQVHASRASAFINGVPVVTVVSSWIILGERLAPLEAVGGAIVLGAVLLPNGVSLIRRGRLRPAHAMSRE